MYNHYIPQSDGSFRRHSIPENNRRQQRPAQSQQPTSPPPPPPQKEEPKAEHKPEQAQCQQQPPHHEEKHEPRREEGIFSFLRRLLPRDLDSFDLIIIALLLLLSGEDCEEDTASLLTLALYFLL